ncbi:unnamed protein product [Protopolystoma xenopodis]|uniref:Uncharacterized protein n=1 Tax=Protopolystoma xenopodis TaxID=117903 RepID=A0A448WEM1_9PLAT|nr:unnamed protein product [Protopolystoma xenopodis]
MKGKTTSGNSHSHLSDPVSPPGLSVRDCPWTAQSRRLVDDFKSRQRYRVRYYFCFLFFFFDAYHSASTSYNNIADLLAHSQFSSSSSSSSLMPFLTLRITRPLAFSVSHSFRSGAPSYSHFSWLGSLRRLLLLPILGRFSCLSPDNMNARLYHHIGSSQPAVVVRWRGQGAEILVTTCASPNFWRREGAGKSGAYGRLNACLPSNQQTGYQVPPFPLLEEIVCDLRRISL